MNGHENLLISINVTKLFRLRDLHAITVHVLCSNSFCAFFSIHETHKSMTLFLFLLTCHGTGLTTVRKLLRF